MRQQVVGTGPQFLPRSRISIILIAYVKFPFGALKFAACGQFSEIFALIHIRDPHREVRATGNFPARIIEAKI